MGIYLASKEDKNGSVSPSGSTEPSNPQYTSRQEEISKQKEGQVYFLNNLHPRIYILLLITNQLYYFDFCF